MPTNGARKNTITTSGEWTWTPTSHHIKKINSKWIKDLNVRAKGMQFLEDNVDVNIFVMLDHVMVS